MKIKTIEASLSRESRYNYDLKEWKGYRLVAELEDGENESVAKCELDKLLEQWHEPTGGKALSVNPEYADHLPSQPTPDIQVEKPLSIVDNLIKQINECSSDMVLKTFALLVRKYPKATDAYNSKLKTFLK